MSVPFLWVLFALAADASGPETLQLLPQKILLSGAEARQRVTLERQLQGKFIGERKDAVVVSDDPAIVAVENGRSLKPVANGTTTIRATAGGIAATASVTVVGMERPFAWSFRNHVQSVLTKQGCNSGACHGAIAGKNGFRLTLRGFGAETDYATLTRQANGRRVDLQDPGRSLLLLKPSTAVAHGGGLRLPVDSPEYRVLAEWVANGAPPPRSDDPLIDRIEVLPSAATLAPGDEQQLLVRAFFSDGHVEDVTRWAKYSSANAETAIADDLGLVKVSGHGEGAITAWYLNKLAVATITAPYPVAKGRAEFAAKPANFIDEIVLEKLKELNVPPSPHASDEEFLRRVTIDTTGALPTPAQREAFLTDPAATRREKLVDRLLASPEFVDYWTYRWSDLLLVNSDRLRPPAMFAYSRWIRERVAAGTPWDALVRELLVAQGSSLENGAVNFFALHPDPMELIETVSTAFMGMPLNCCRCHNHPLEKWTNDQYFGFLNLVSRTRQKSGPGDGNIVVFADRNGDIVQPLTGKIRSPQPLDGAPIRGDDPSDRRRALADWLTSPSNPYFTRAIVNRVWANYLGVGLVEKVDDLRLTNPASNEKLLTALAKHLTEKKYDLKALMRTIATSATYARSSTPTAGNENDRRFYSRYYPRRLMAEVLLDGFAQVTSAPTAFANYPAGFRALQLPDSNVSSYFLEKFGRPDRIITCDCERNSEPSMVQVLHLSNGDALNKKLAEPKNRIGAALAAKTPPERIVQELYLTALCRPAPGRVEKAFATEFAAAKDDASRRQVVEDLYWGVLSSKEFLFNR
ncbi:MAG TPA: DUF1549 domain-containing protein [Planctomycetia bacterium]|nr:DUF1549 domain-containing protein [Planctomycetia bacterium]